MAAQVILPATPSTANCCARWKRRTAASVFTPKMPSAAPQAKQPGGLTVDYAAEISKELSALLGRKVQLTDGKKTGKIELEFYGSDDREALIDQLKSLKK